MKIRPQNIDADKHADIADTVDDERFHRRVRCGLLFIPMTNEQIGTDTDEFPKNVHHEKVIRDDDTEH